MIIFALVVAAVGLVVSSMFRTTITATDSAGNTFTGRVKKSFALTKPKAA